ncbi:MAG TPA: hypothetical protein VGC39_03425, partial [Candidatus Methylacidiphilales bacterium]
GLWQRHVNLGTAMEGQIKFAAGANADQSAYKVVEAANLYRATGVASDYAVSLQFLIDNKLGDNRMGITFESGSKFDGGFFPTPGNGQYQKVERDIHAGVVGFLLQIVAWAANGPLAKPLPLKH